MALSIDAVLNSRAGDRFHYLWAARRCLKMIQPNSTLRHVRVERSSEPNEAGELVIDLEERHVSESGEESFHYYQMKHSTVRLDKETAPSELKSTLKGFAQRHQSASKASKSAKRFYYYISNRLVSRSLKEAVSQLVRGGFVDAKMTRKLSSYTTLPKASLKEFFSSFSFQDQEDGYERLEEELHFDLAHVLAGTVEEGMTHRLIGLISDQALPKAKKSRTQGMIIQVDVLRVLGVRNPNGLFPAPAAFEPLTKAFKREQHVELARQITSWGVGHIIIHAEGGVGKSVVAQQLQNAMPKHSFCLAYDCFGGGNYRSPSHSRHRPRDALMQMANEMALAGLSSMLIVPDRLAEPEIFKAFMCRIESACELIAKRSSKALMVLFIDAADNAEMAAAEFGDNSFAKLLIREKLPRNCRLIFLCRTERRKLLHPPTTALQIRLNPFSLKESNRHLKAWHPKASSLEMKEFFRLTGGNPRVQATCLALSRGTVREVLRSLGRRRLTANKQIGNQLKNAIAQLRNTNPKVERDQIDAICRGLAILPPFVPVSVLAAAAKVERETVVSFVNDLGRPLRHTDQLVQFRDEPTETWFKDTFAASQEEFSAYASALEPLAATHTYVARALPALWNQAGEHAKLIELALSDRLLPESNPMDARDVRIYRLQFALRAALKTRRMVDAAKLALRAGEEMAGNSRQLELLENNPDLMAALQDTQLVQECAYKRQLKGSWAGSEEVYAASLFSWNRDFEGEASSCLRSAEQWLSRYFEERDKTPKQERLHDDKLQRSEIAELGWAYLGIGGAAAYCQFILRWRPPDVIREVTGIVVGRLVDAGKFSLIDSIAKHGERSFPLLLALCDELNAVSKFPPKSCLSYVFATLTGNEEELSETDHYSSNPNPFQKALLSFAEACAHHQLSSDRIQNLLEPLCRVTPANLVIANDYNKVTRHTFVRALTLRSLLKGEANPQVEMLIPDPPIEAKEHDGNRQERKDARTVIKALLSRYELRAKMLTKSRDWEALKVRDTVFPALATAGGDYYSSRSRIESFWDEIPLLELNILALQFEVTEQDWQHVLKSIQKEGAAWRSLSPRIQMTRISYRHQTLHELGTAIEEICQQDIHKINKPEAEGRDHWFIMMSRAVLSQSQPDASAYFNLAVEETAKFGDELVPRWGAVTEIAAAAGAKGQDLSELAYRYSRVAELVGMSVSREKDWDRSKVFKTLARIHPPSAFTCLGRCIERDLGYIDRLIGALFRESVKTGILSGASAFAVSGFGALHACKHYLKDCLHSESMPWRRQMLFDQVALDLCQANKLLSERKEMEDTGRQHGLKLDCLNEFLLRMERIQPTVRIANDQSRSTQDTRPTNQEEAKTDLLSGYDLTTTRGLAKAIQLATKPRVYPQPRLEWSELMQRIPRGQELAFLDAAIIEPEVSYYELKSIASYTRRNWMTRVSVAREWPKLLQRIGRKCYVALSENQCWGKSLEESPFHESEMPSLHLGAIQQMENSSSLLYSTPLFGFAALAISGLGPSDVQEVLDFALGRFEKHLTPDFGDGPWAAWLHPPENVLNSYTGWIWCCLGNPDSAIRWEATHCVRRLIEMDCHSELQSLLQWRGKAEVTAYLGKDFVFYDLQAQIQLLCGLARGALGRPEKLRPYVKTFYAMACQGIPHALIQWEASQLVLGVEQSFPGTLSADELHRVQSVRVSPFERRTLKKDEVVHTPWHQSGTHIWPEKLYFDMDFREYWLDSLCGLFGIPRDELLDLWREAAEQELGVVCGGDFPGDARRSVWESRRSDSRTTYHSHGSYPAVYSFHFFYALHSWMIVAAKLFQTMPLVNHEGSYWGDKDWSEWLSRHQLTPPNGYWLSDRLDPLLPRRDSKQAHHTSNWLFEVKADDFYELMTTQASIPGGLCVDAHWHDPEYSNCETVSISSAFVFPEMANSLANALRHEGDVHFCSLNGIMNTEDHTVYDPIFQLTPLVDIHRNNESGLDKFDPHACGVEWLKNRINMSLLTEMNLSSDPLERIWHLPGHKSPAMILESWSEIRDKSRHSYTRCGHRLFASLDFLLQTCRKRKQSLVIEVEIRRSSERSRFDDMDFSYPPPSKKVFILTENGILQDTRKNYQLG